MSVIYRKNSFDRFGDDLIELVLSYISFEDSFQYKCVSKQWKRLVFNKQNKLIINNKSKINLINESISEVNLKVFEIILKNCRNITSIDFNKYGINYKSFRNIDKLFHLFNIYCNNLSKIYFQNHSIGSSFKSFEIFCRKFGPNLKMFENYNKNYLFYDFIKFCPNLTQLSVKHLRDVFRTENQVFCSKLKSFKFYWISSDNSKFDSFIESNRKSLQSISISFEKYNAIESDINIIFNSLSKLTKLKSLSLSLDYYSKPIEMSFVNKLEILSKNCKELKKLYFDVCCDAIEVFEYIFLTITKFKSLENLSIRMSRFRTKYILSSKLFNKLENIKHLSFVSNLSDIIISDTFFESIDRYLPKLQSLRIESPKTDITGKSFKYLSKLPKLHSIELHFDCDYKFKFNESDIKQFIINSLKINSIKLYEYMKKFHEIDINDKKIYDMRNGKDVNISKNTFKI